MDLMTTARQAKSEATYTNWQQNHNKRSTESSDKISEMKRMINGTEKKSNEPRSILESTQKYGQSIRAERSRKKETSSQLKQLKYNYSNISTQIRKSKTSVNAKQVASKARREVILLKMKLQSGNYDKEELEAAITHAKSMERAANKKARHLQEEELIKVTDNASSDMSASEFEEQLEEKMDQAYEEYDAAMEEFEAEQVRDLEEQMSQMEELSEDMYSLLSDTMDEMMEDTLSQLMDGMMIVTDYEMSEDEFNSYKQKHRILEDKAMLEADAKYLKTLFEIYDRRINGGGGASIPSGGADFSGAGAVINSVDVAAAIPNIVDISL